MKNDEIREFLAEQCPQAVIFDNPYFDNSIIGFDDSRVVYDFDKMCEEFSSDNDCTLVDSQEFIEYNTIRTLPYIESSHRPIIMYGIEQ